MDRARDMKEWMDSVHEAISDLQTWRVNTDDSIKALTDRVKELESKRHKMPPTGPVRFGPILNDGKADPVHEAICKAPDNTFICQQCGHIHELPQFQRPPFVTGLSVNDGKPTEDAVRKWMMLPDYCVCETETETWFDRTMTTDGKGNVLQDMCTRCCVCGKEKKSKPSTDIFCSFCGSEHEYRNLFPGVNACICRSCIAQALEWKEAQ